MEIELYDDRMGRLYDAGLGGLWLVNPNVTNLDDMLDSWRPGAIVRVTNIHDAVKFIPAGDESLMGCIAGWISEEDEAAEAKVFRPEDEIRIEDIVSPFRMSDFEVGNG